jgi:hypothetical protein
MQNDLQDENLIKKLGVLGELCERTKKITPVEMRTIFDRCDPSSLGLER